MSNAHALSAARGTRPLFGRHLDQIVDAPQMRRGRGFVRAAGAVFAGPQLPGIVVGLRRIEPRRSEQPLIGLLELVGREPRLRSPPLEPH